MNFTEYQALALRTAPQQGQLDGLVHAGQGLCTEVGEFTSEVKRMAQYSKPMSAEMHAHMVEEVGDILWYLALACHHLSVPLQSIARLNIIKLEQRFKDKKFSAEAAEGRADKGGLPHTES
jgi:NTP pyrophosphatase (non-canonical NTP hydrolase)